MSRPIVTVPRDLMRTTEFNWDFHWSGQSHGDLNTGTGQIVVNRFPRWVGSVPLVLPVELRLKWQAVRAEARGRQALYRVPMIDYPALRLLGLAAQLVEQIPFDDGALFDGGVGFEYDPFIVAAEDIPAGATDIAVDETPLGLAVVPGLKVGHNDWPFQITSRYLKDGQTRLGVDLVRAPIPQGSPISLAPYGLFQAASDNTGNPSFGLDEISRPVMEFREWINR